MTGVGRVPAAQTADPEITAMVRQVARDYLAREWPPDAISARETDPGHSDGDLWARMGQMGWSGLLVPQRLGGGGHGVAQMRPLVEELARVGLPSPLFSAAVEATSVLVLAGDEPLQEALLPGVAAGTAVLSTAFWELGHAFDLDAICTTARPQADGTYLLTGTKFPVEHARQAPGVLCTARVEGEPGLFVVSPESPGVALTSRRTTSGEDVFTMSLEGVRVGPGDRVTTTHPIDDLLLAVLDRCALLKAAELLSMGQRALDLTIAYTCQRKQFGRPIASFQAVQHHCADMYRDVEATRVLVDQAFAGFEAGHPSTWEVAAAKAKASRSMMDVLERAHQLHGGVGFYVDYPLERLYRRGMVAQGAYGSARWHRRRLVQLLRDDPTRFRRRPHDV